MGELFWGLLKISSNFFLSSQGIYNLFGFYRSISRSDLQEYVSNHYKPPRIVLAGAGGVEHGELVKLADKLFSKLSVAYTGEIPVIEPCRYTGSDVRVRDDFMPLAHIAVSSLKNSFDE